MKLWVHRNKVGGRRSSTALRAGLQYAERPTHGRLCTVGKTEMTNHRLESSISSKASSSDCPLTLLCIGALSALFASVLLSYTSVPSTTSLPSRVLELSSETAKQADWDHQFEPSPAREAFLFGVLSQEAFARKSQIRFISSLIQSQLEDHPDPEGLAHLIVSESISADYDPLFVAAVIRSESMFSRGAISIVGARGLMQIMPATGRFICDRENIVLGPRGLHDPRINVKLGIAYLKYLESMFQGNRARALIAYNWGPANLGSALRRKAAPPSSTVKYAQKIISTHAKWKNQYMQLASNTTRTIG